MGDSAGRARCGSATGHDTRSADICSADVRRRRYGWPDDGYGKLRYGCRRHGGSVDGYGELRYGHGDHGRTNDNHGPSNGDHGRTNDDHDGCRRHGRSVDGYGSYGFGGQEAAGGGYVEHVHRHHHG